MKKLIFILFFFPFLAKAQKALPRFENDTLTTTSGFKIYKGKILQFGNGTGKNGKFRYINIKNEVSTAQLANNSIVVQKMKNYGISVLGNGYIEIIGVIIFKDGSKGYVDIHMAFDKAIQNAPGSPGELIVPE